MKILKEAQKRPAKVIDKKKISQDEIFRLSLYAYLFTENGRFLINHTLTREVIELSEAEWNLIQIIRETPQNYDFLSENGLTELALKRYIVETGYDEAKQYQQTIFLLKTMAGKKPGLSSYIILPTTGCNARCIYCYEEGYPVGTMNKETVDRLIDFICETKQDGKINISWFGGEPLVCAETISHICRLLQDRGVEYTSDMITNASLLTKELAHEAKELWHLKKVQVSLDGKKDDYTYRKNYYAPEKHNYDVVMQAIHYFADEDINVNLRVNTDGENISRISSFLDDIKAEFGDMKNISLYISALYQAQVDSEQCIEVYRQIFQLKEKMRVLGITQTLKHERRTDFRVNHCMADNMEKSIVITPDGSFYNCEHMPEGRSWGNIFDGVTNEALFNELKKPVETDEQCRKCPFLPQCLPYFKKGCPLWYEKCYEVRCMRTNSNLHYILEDNGGDDEFQDEC